MAKEEKAAKAETTTVEMTEQQKKDYLKFLEKQEEARILKDDEEKDLGASTVVNLSWQHNINGKKFGPGRNIEVPVVLVGLLQHQEDTKRMAEIKMLTANKRTFEVLQSGGAIEVGGQKRPAGLR